MRMANTEVGLDGKNGFAYLSRSLVQEKFNHNEDALADASKACSMDPKEYAFAIQKAQIELRLERLDLAVKDCHLAREADRPEHAEAYEIEGCCRLLQGKLKEALTCFDRAISEDPQSGSAFYHRALLYQLNGNGLRAQQDLIRAQDNNYVPDEWDKRYTTRTDSPKRQKSTRER